MHVAKCEDGACVSSSNDILVVRGRVRWEQKIIVKRRGRIDCTCFFGDQADTGTSNFGADHVGLVTAVEVQHIIQADGSDDCGDVGDTSAKRWDRIPGFVGRYALLQISVQEIEGNDRCIIDQDTGHLQTAAQEKLTPAGGFDRSQQWTTLASTLVVSKMSLKSYGQLFRRSFRIEQREIAKLKSTQTGDVNDGEAPREEQLRYGSRAVFG